MNINISNNICNTKTKTEQENQEYSTIPYTYDMAVVATMSGT